MQTSTPNTVATTSAVPPHQPAKIVSGPQNRSFSIKASLQKQREQHEQEEEQLTLISMATPFTQEQLEQAWRAYIKIARERLIVCQTMQSSIPTATEDFQLVMHVNGATQLEEMQNEQVALTNHLRTSLKNGKITLSLEVVEQKNSNINTMNALERAQLMIEHNPNIQKLIEALNLKLA